MLVAAGRAFARAPRLGAVLALVVPFTPRLLRAALHVFAKSADPTDDPSKVFVPDGADVGVLKKAVVRELELGVAPRRVRLFREAAGGARVLINSRESLAEQGVRDGCNVVAEALANNAALLPPRALSMNADPLAEPRAEFRGLEHCAEHSAFYRAARAATPSAVCPASPAWPRRPKAIPHRICLSGRRRSSVPSTPPSRQ